MPCKYCKLNCTVYFFQFIVYKRHLCGMYIIKALHVDDWIYFEMLFIKNCLVYQVYDNCLHLHTYIRENTSILKKEYVTNTGFVPVLETLESHGI